jgi:hypothetical protein
MCWCNIGSRDISSLHAASVIKRGSQWNDLDLLLDRLGKFSKKMYKFPRHRLHTSLIAAFFLSQVLEQFCCNIAHKQPVTLSPKDCFSPCLYFGVVVGVTAYVGLT